MLANVTAFKCIVFLTVVRDWNDRKEMSRKHPILSLYKILLVKDTVTTIMMGCHGCEGERGILQPSVCFLLYEMKPAA